MSSEPPVFQPLTSAHAALDEVFWLHREALVLGKLALARELFGAHAVLLRAHLGYEEELLVPELERRVEPKRWPAVLYTGQHAKMLNFLERIAARLDVLGTLDTEAQPWARPALEILDIEATYLHLVEHHNQAEEAALYPELERHLPLELKRSLCDLCLTRWLEAERSVKHVISAARAVLSASSV